MGHFVVYQRKGEKEIEEIVEETKERDREERGTGIKGKKQKKYKHSPLPLPATRIASLAQLKASISWRHLCHTRRSPPRDP